MTVMSKILFVDDEESVLKGIVLNLGKKFDITIATSPVEALQLLKDGNKFSVVVIDYIMPGMNECGFIAKYSFLPITSCDFVDWCN